MGSCQVIKLHIIHVVTWREDISAGIVCMPIEVVAILRTLEAVVLVAVDFTALK